MSPSCRCHPPVRSSTQPRTSGSICDRPISPTVCSRPTPTSSTPAKTPGENFSPKPGASPRSRLATGPSSVSSSEGWYYVPVKREPVIIQVQSTKASSALLRLRQVALAAKDFVHPCPDRERVRALRRGNHAAIRRRSTPLAVLGAASGIPVRPLSSALPREKQDEETV